MSRPPGASNWGNVTVVIDTLAFRVRCDDAFALPTGRVMSITPGGEVEWQTMKFLSLRGSHESTVAIRPTLDRDHQPTLYISGSPAKWLQGHNIFGTDNLPGLVVALWESLVPVLLKHGVTVSDLESEAVRAGRVELLRVDINYSFSTGSRANAIAWISAAVGQAHMQHRGRGILQGDTGYWGLKSRYSVLKAYCKGQEIQAKGHQLPLDLRGIGLEQWADDKLRLEVTLLARELRRESLANVANWTPETPHGIFMHHLERLHISGEVSMNEEDLQGLPGGARTAYLAWKSGQDLKVILPRPTFYRHRKAIMELLGVDIATRSPDARPGNVIPLRRVVEAVPVDIPDWARGTPLYFEPRKVG